MPADFQPGKVFAESFAERQPPEARGCLFAVILRRVHGGNDRRSALGYAVCAQKRAGHVYNRVASPRHFQARFRCDAGYYGCVQVFFPRGADKALCIAGRKHYGHAFLRLGDGELRAVESLVLLGDFVEVDGKAVRELPDGDADAARAEVVAALDQAHHVRVAEQALDLALGGRVALLDFRAADLDGLLRVGFGRTRCPAAAVASGGSAEQDDDVAGPRLFAHHVFLRRRADDRADFHALRHIAGVVKLRHLPGRKADLVAIGTVPVRGTRRDLARRQLAFQRFFKRNARIAGTGDPHGLVNVRSAGKRVADCPAEAGRRAAERFNFRRVVVRFVLEFHKPFLRLAVHCDGHFDGARVDLLAQVEVGDLAAFAQQLHADNGHVHQRYGTVRLSVDFLTRVVVRLKCAFNGTADSRFFHFDFIQTGQKRRVAAVVAPIGVDDAKLRHGRVAVLRAAEIVTAEREVFEAHGEPHRGVVFFQLVLVP